MTDLTPAQRKRFHGIYKRWTNGATPEERAAGETLMDQWLAKYGKTRADLTSLVAEAHADELKKSPPSPPPDPRDSAPNPFDLKRYDPASLVEDSLKQYVTMDESVAVISTLWTIFIWVYERFSIAPRLALTSEWPESGKTTLKNVIRRLARRPNRGVVSTGPMLARFFNQGPGLITLDETDFLDAETKRNVQLMWNLGHECDAEKELLIGGKPTLLKLYGPMLAAGLGGSLGGLLTPTQESRTLLLDLKQYTEETKPPRDYALGPDNPEAGITNGIDVAALTHVRAFLREWAPQTRFKLNPPTPGMIARHADNARGLLSVADACNPQWAKRARDVFDVLLEREKATRPWVLILRHALMIADTLELERVPSVLLNRELLRLDVPEAKWNRYRGPVGGETAHSLTLDEQAMLLKMSGIEPKPMRPVGGGKLFRGLERSWLEEALRRYEPASGGPRLRLITPKSD